MRFLPLIVAVVIAAVPPEALFPWLPRSVALALIGLRLCSGLSRPAVWLSPLLWLGTSATLVYVVGPILLDLIRAPDWGDWLGHGNMAALSNYVGSQAEVLVLQFAIAALAVDHAISRAPETSELALPPALWSILVVLALGTGLAHLPGFVPRLSVLTDFGPPVIAISVMALVTDMKARGGWRHLAVPIVIILVFVPVVLSGTAKSVIFTLCAAALMLLPARAAPGLFLAKIAAGTIVLLALTVAVLFVMDHVRYNDPREGEGGGGHLLRVILSKGVIRQAETGHCLAGVVNSRPEESLFAGLALIPQILTPRALWPDKPNFSRGDEYYGRFCDRQASGSAAITLLGQPLAEGGRSGLLLAAGGMLAAMALLTRGLAGTGSGRVMLAALMPWLIDFDQDFALVWGNAVKFAIVMAPVAWLVYRYRVSDCAFLHEKFPRPSRQAGSQRTRFKK